MHLREFLEIIEKISLKNATVELFRRKLPNLPFSENSPEVPLRISPGFNLRSPPEIAPSIPPEISSMIPLENLMNVRSTIHPRVFLKHFYKIPHGIPKKGVSGSFFQVCSRIFFQTVLWDSFKQISFAVFPGTLSRNCSKKNKIFQVCCQSHLPNV